MPVVIVGTRVEEKPNFMAVAWFSKVNSNPPMMMISLGKKQYTTEGIKEYEYFSINLPGTDLVTETDYCGIVSGRNEDKARLFEIFHGDPENAPMLQGCRNNYDLKLAETIELPGSYLFIGEIVGAYVDEDKRKAHMPDVPQVKPFLLVESPPNYYFELGSQTANAFRVGKELKLNP